MKWKRFTIQTKPEAEDLIADLLLSIGITGAEIRDRTQVLTDEEQQLFEEVMPRQEADDGLAEIVFYLDEDEDAAPYLSKVREGLRELREFMDVGTGEITEDETEDQDWVNNWKEHFKAFRIDDILIAPTWDEDPLLEAEAAVSVRIDPGTAFGTGSHETTQLVIRALRKYLKPGDSVLDVGTGSGILGIIALKLGASYVFGTDIDEMAVDTARENAALNGIPEGQFTAVLGNIIDDPETQKTAGFEAYDVCVANILADIIIPLQKVVYQMVKPGGLLVFSGIIDLKEEAVREAVLMNPHLAILETSYQGEWVSFTCRRIS
ncbi:MAG: 50S ribosomal protein L11 methyltransferase [Lachnospiraceae bacterium]|nr:50S ribosomal protein L11 methyltransferase [Lachnospiraceae bacterium]